MLLIKIKCGVGNPEIPMNAAFLALYATFFAWPHIAYNVARHIICGKTACTVRREGERVSALPTPIANLASAVTEGLRGQRHLD